MSQEVNLPKLWFQKEILRMSVGTRSLIKRYRRCWKEVSNLSIISVVYSLVSTLSRSRYTLNIPSKRMILVSCILKSHCHLSTISLKSKIINLKLGHWILPVKIVIMISSLLLISWLNAGNSLKIQARRSLSRNHKVLMFLFRKKPARKTTWWPSVTSSANRENKSKKKHLTSTLLVCAKSLPRMHQLR